MFGAIELPTRRISWELSRGLISGIAVKLIMPGKDLGGMVFTIFIGIAGALLGGTISSLFGFGVVTGFILAVWLSRLGAHCCSKLHTESGRDRGPRPIFLT